MTDTPTVDSGISQLEIPSIPKAQSPQSVTQPGLAEQAIIARIEETNSPTLSDLVETDGQREEAVRSVEEFFAEGPKFKDILHDSVDRSNHLSSEVRPPPLVNRFLWREVPDGERARTFTEREGLGDLDVFLETTIDTARNVGDTEVLDRATFIRDNLVFIGENELQEAINGIAERAISAVSQGQDVFIATVGLRSERYISLRVLEQIDQLTADNPKLRKRIHFSENIEEIAQKLKSLDGKGKIVIPDDFAVSGNRVEAFAGRVFDGLLSQGYSPEEAMFLIEVNVITDVDKSDSNKTDRHILRRQLDNGEQFEQAINVFSYYHVNYPRRPDGGTHVMGGAMTGSHASVDYGFEMPMEDFQRFLFENGIKLQNPLLTRIKRPYDFDNRPGSRTYEDPGLQQRWDQAMATYRIAA